MLIEFISFFAKIRKEIGTEEKKIPLCASCRKHHPGECLWGMNRCYVCGRRATLGSDALNLVDFLGSRRGLLALLQGVRVRKG